MNSKILYRFLLFIPLLLQAQNKGMTMPALFKKVSAIYSSNDYISYSSNYKMYPNYTTKEVSEDYDGVVIKKNGVYYYKIKDIEFLSFKDVSLKISNSEKAIVISKNTNSISPSPLSLDSYLKGFESKMIENSQFWICELSPKGLSQIMFSKIIIHINKSDYSIAKQELFFLNAMPSKDKKGKQILEKPRMVVTFSPRAKQEIKDNILVDKKQYFTQIGKKVIVAKKYSTYKLFNT